MYPQNAHYIWIGNNPLPQYAISNIILFKAQNPHYTVNLWTTSPHKLTNAIINSGYSTRFARLINCREFPAMSGYVKSAIDREMCGNTYFNYAAASDILRLVILQQYGGIYMDVDVMVSGPLGPIQPKMTSFTGPSDILIHRQDMNKKYRTSNAVIVSQPHTNTLKKMINYAIFPYTKNSIYNMGMSHNVGNDWLSKALREKELENMPLWEIMWIGKRAIPHLRHKITMYLTGPGLMDSYLQASSINHRFMATKILDQPSRFGQRETGPLGRWSWGMNDEGRWVNPGRKMNNTL